MFHVNGIIQSLGMFLKFIHSPFLVVNTIALYMMDHILFLQSPAGGLSNSVQFGAGMKDAAMSVH